ncbi:Scr1 family TA system antitoxin-like transcriptional regulator [Streptomyces sp. PRh5]|uniref:Scr1 family TA system antitoxin-like transcriptional regulator n=1 Tax=Streptomyces sp. PRh5 TaxID=1158056 RepID=UPI000684616A|nr:Scr1 family TA system antitoxin-like transcriptional regulator [Streptomyces sp. PRh5]
MGLRANPTYRQRRFGAEVRKLREQAGLTVGDSAAVMGMQQSHISNVESGRTGLSPERVRALAQAGGSEDSTYVDALVAMGQASGKGWWSAYRNKVPASRMDAAELEAGADAMVCYEPMFVPGLLQTREYSRDIMRAQLLRLIELSRLRNVTVQILPFDGPVPFGTSFTLIQRGGVEHGDRAAHRAVALPG